MGKRQDLTLNVLPLQIEEDGGIFHFYERRPEGRKVWPIKRHEMPQSLASKTNCEILYTDFCSNDARQGTDLCERIIFSASPKFARHYMNYRIFSYFEGKAKIRHENFISNCELWFTREKDAESEVATFDRYIVRITYGRFTDGFELTVMYRGTRKVWLKPVYDYPGASTDLNLVVWDGKLGRYEELADNQEIDRATAYPVINRQMERELKLSAKRKSGKKNRLKHHDEMIEEFRKTYLDSAEFRDHFKPEEEFMRVMPADAHRINTECANLTFGNGFVSKDPYSGLKKGGPYRPPSYPHIELFLIVSEKDAEPIGNQLYSDLRNGKGHFPGLNRFARIPIRKSASHITFKNCDNPLPEIREKLRLMKKEKGIHYGAIYISPISKDDPDPKRHKVYYRVKEELLKYEITSQVIDRESILNKGFAFYLPNIATALIAKMGGVPWTLSGKLKKELVIGVGAYSPNQFRKRYLGSAFCFSETGDFRGFNAFQADNTIKLAGSFQKTVRSYVEENEGAERVVIHYYKRLNRKESIFLRKKLLELKLNIPIVVLTIQKSLSDDVVITDRTREDRLPLSGTWMQSGSNQFLLCNNTRLDDPGEKIKSYPFPVKIYIDLAADREQMSWTAYRNLLKEQLRNEKWVEELLEQVFRFSRLNWQTVSIKSLPVTIRYPEMVARKFPYFEGDILPEFGKRNFWFL